MHSSLVIGLALLALASVASPAFAGTSIGTTTNAAPANNSVGISANYFGQVFTAPTSDSVLNSFSIQVGLVNPSTNFSLYAFDSATGYAAGPALFTSGPVTGTVVPTGLTPFTALEDTYQTGGLKLTGGSQYLALIENVTSLQTQAPLFFDSPYMFQHYPGYDYYTGGAFVAGNGTTEKFYPVFDNIGPDFRADLAFRADFGSPNSVPEASTTVSLGLLLALGGVAVAVRKGKGRASL